MRERLIIAAIILTFFHHELGNVQQYGGAASCFGEK